MCTALIIEDVPHVRKFLFDLLKDYYRPIEVKEASNGVEALDILANEQIDLLVTDIFMPFMDGFSFLEKAQEAQPDIETIIVSAYDDFEYAMKVIEMNVRAFLLKPVSKVELYKAMDLVFQSLDKRRKNREMVQNLEQKLWEEQRSRELREICMGQRMESRFFAQDVRKYSFVLIRFSGQDKEENHQELYKALQDVQSIESFRTQKPEWFPTGYEQEYAVIFATKEPGGDAALFFMETLQKQMAAKKKNVWMARVDKKDTYAILGVLQRQARYLLRQRFLLGDGQHCIEGTVKEKVADTQEVEPFDKTEALNALCRLSLSSEEEIDPIFDTIFQQFREKRPGLYLLTLLYEQLRELYLNLAHVIGLETMEMGSMFDVCTLDFFADLQDLKAKTVSAFRSLFSKSEQTKGSSSRVVNFLKQYIEENWDQKVRLHDLATSLYMNEDYIGRLFKSETGKGFVQYLTEVRMNHALSMVRDTNKKVTEIALSTGYNSTSNFITVFRKTFGMTPVAMRESLEKTDEPS